MNQTIRSAALPYPKHGCRRMYAGTHTEPLYIDIMIHFFEGTGIGQELFSSRPHYGILGTGISRSNRFVRAPSSGPSPCLIRYVLRRERGWTPSETSEECAKIVF